MFFKMFSLLHTLPGRLRKAGVAFQQAPVELVKAVAGALPAWLHVCPSLKIGLSPSLHLHDYFYGPNLSQHIITSRFIEDCPYREEVSLGLMKVEEFYEENVSTVYYSNGFSILFLNWKKCIFGLYFLFSSSCLQFQSHVRVAGMKQVRGACWVKELAFWLPHRGAFKGLFSCSLLSFGSESQSLPGL